MAESSSRSAAYTAIVQRGLTGAVLLVFLLSGGPAFSGDADVAHPVQVPATGMKSGLLTAKHDNSVETDSGTYVFHSKVVFADDEGRLRAWKEFKNGDRIQFHLKQGRVDYLILVLPK